MAWEVEYTDEFGQWWESLNEEEQVDVAAIVGLLEAKGPTLSYPYSSEIKGSKYGQMRELRIQHKGRRKKEDPIEFFMPSTQDELQYCWSEGKKRGTINGTIR